MTTEQRHHHRAAARDTHAVLPVAIGTGPNAGVDFFFSWSKGSGGATLARSLRAFRRPAARPLAAPGTIAFPATPTFTPEPSRAQLLLSSGSAQIVGYPTRQGDVCYVLVRASGSCSPTLGDGAIPMVDRGQVWGLIDDDAVAVDVLVPVLGILHAAIGRNAFYLRLPNPVRAPSEIVVLERDGVRHIYTIKVCHVSQNTPLAGKSPLPPPPC